MHNEFPDLSIKKLLSDNFYTVPRYQRNYAWTEEQIKQLIDDILDNCKKEDEDPKPYYLGTLVVSPRQSPMDGAIYEVIDGQQRLTTLTLLASYLTYAERTHQSGNGHWFSGINLGFMSRKRSSETLNAAHNGDFHDNGNKPKPRASFTEEIVDGYEIIQRLLPQRCLEKNVDKNDFKIYFFRHVRICRVTVPDDTELNHYFEIMNNRGEQLEKHEVLKARLLEKLAPGADQYVFNKIWEACSSMDRYVQYEFHKQIRPDLFSTTWDNFLPEDSDELFQLLEKQYMGQSNDDENSKPSLKQLVKDPTGNKGTNLENENKGDEEEPERFSSIINFQNFLPHTLSIFLEDGSVALDDKQLLDSFQRLIDKGAESIKAFGYALLNCRFLFDQYIIKRDATEDEREWSLKKLHQTEQGNPSYKNSFSEDGGFQKEISLLQSMFHVSIPSRPYKYWLQGTLRYLYTQENFTASDFKEYLEGQAKSFVYNRFLASKPLDYDELIFINQGRPVESHLNLKKTRYGSIENILVFNFIDYLLWKEKKEEDAKVRDFIYSFRSSVEHYYPQNPIDGNSLADEEVLHSIGNLCLISHSKNSMLRHHLPKAKAEYYLKQKHIDSVLQHEMLLMADEWSTNPEDSIKRQELRIIVLLENQRP